MVDETEVDETENTTRTAASVDEKSVPPTPPPEEARSATYNLSARAASAGRRTKPLAPLLAGASWIASATARKWRRCGDGDRSLQGVGRDTARVRAESCRGEASIEVHSRPLPRPLEVSRGSYKALTSGRRILGEIDQATPVYGKVHVRDRVHYLLMDQDIQLKDLARRLRDKLNLQSTFVIQTRNGNDMVTIEDQEDLTVAVLTGFGAGQLKNEDGNLDVSDH